MLTHAISGLFMAVHCGWAAAPAAAPERPVLEATDYGALVAGDGPVTAWWCEAMYKVGRDRPAPTEGNGPARFAAARNEFEAVQVVLRSKKPITGVQLSCAGLRGPGEARIKPEDVSLLRVAYVPVSVPTDKRGRAGNWPDPLPPIDGPIDLAADANQPVWILVHVPADAAPGDYRGTLEVRAQGVQIDVPLELHVWDFALPSTPRTQTALGLAMGTVYRYHHATTPEQQRLLFEKYMQCFADHRITPYNPTPFDPMKIRFITDAEPMRAEIDFERFDTAMQQAIDRWHITSFNLHLPGMGGGTFHERNEGEIAGYKPGSPQYETLFASMVKQIESHLREKGWLDKAYIYWFDEPNPSDYEFVKTRMDRVKKHAPGLCRMLTEEPVEPLFGSVDLWCLILDAFDANAVAARRAAGDRFWWYICTGPKAPYVTEFIDHPDTNLRVWCWQTWQHQISGLLIWETVYWTSGTAFPDTLQNPYADPMSYVSGYGTPAGTKKPWGNGDGRFLYPPVAAAGGAKEFVADGPVSSIRWEMLRDGIEDLDYCYLLSDRMAAGGKPNYRVEVPESITEALTSYTFDPKAIYEHRQRVAEQIEKLR